ncbi:SGNH/GDSL hydrolase family protein [Paenibacillus sp. GYB003]|uniref:SGNH/GDSL hydrolase family protein n=1 Tax=Paenibacillus sp. GYB003 TaxID=2994392 RepID=UPI002F96B23C
MEKEQAFGQDGVPVRQPLYTFNDAWTEWLAGGKFPIAFFGDSTFDGANTTDWVRNVPGTDNVSRNAFPFVLERLLREAAGNSVLRIYNAGFSGQTAKWAETMLEQVFGQTSPYADVKMIGIGFGINDRLGFENEKAYRHGFKRSIERIVHWCLSKGIQPFLLTTQAVVEPGVLTQYADTYPMRTSEHIESVANEAKRELAEQYGLALIDLNRFTESFMQHSSHSLQSIISDKLHFGDVGHKAEAEFLFSRLCPRTIVADGYTKIDFSSQKVFDCVPEDWLTMPDRPADRFKVFVDRPKANADDGNLMSAYVFVRSEKELVLKAYRTGSDPAAYVKVNGDIRPLTGAETNLGPLDFGLYRLDVRTGESAAADFKGFILE